MKILHSLIPVALVTLLVNACDDSTTSNQSSTTKSDFEIACEATGGEHENGKCKCDGIVCNDGDVCNTNSKKCPEKVLPEICVKDSVLCSNGMVYKCNSNRNFVEDETCPNGCLPDFTGCAECISDSCNDGALKKCVDGKYQLPTLCISGQCANETSCTKECQENEQICKEGKVYICEDEHYQESQKCEYGCDHTSNDCASTCSEGATLCFDGQLRTCILGELSPSYPCENNYSCHGENECGSCVNGEIDCVDDPATQIGWMRTCRNGELNKGFICNDDHSCNPSTNQCGQCKNGERRCVTDLETQIGHVELCQNGQYIEETTCEENASCRTATACGECINNTEFCTNDEFEIGTKNICLNGVLIHSPCENSNSCDHSCFTNSNGETICKDRCGNCNNNDTPACGTTQTSINMLLKCEDGNLTMNECPPPYECIPGNNECLRLR